MSRVGFTARDNTTLVSVSSGAFVLNVQIATTSGFPLLSEWIGEGSAPRRWTRNMKGTEVDPTSILLSCHVLLLSEAQKKTKLEKTRAIRSRWSSNPFAAPQSNRTAPDPPAAAQLPPAGPHACRRGHHWRSLVPQRHGCGRKPSQD